MRSFITVFLVVLMAIYIHGDYLNVTCFPTSVNVAAGPVTVACSFDAFYAGGIGLVTGYLSLNISESSTYMSYVPSPDNEGSIVPLPSNTFTSSGILYYTLPQYAPSGVWGSYTILHGASSQSAISTITFFTVQATTNDNAPPQVVSLTLSDINQAAPITVVNDETTGNFGYVTIHITDNLSGVTYISVHVNNYAGEWRPVSGQRVLDAVIQINLTTFQYFWQVGPDGNDIVSGPTPDGTYNSNVSLYFEDKAQVYHRLTDLSGDVNSPIYQASQLQSLFGIDTTYTLYSGAAATQVATSTPSRTPTPTPTQIPTQGPTQAPTSAPTSHPSGGGGGSKGNTGANNPTGPTGNNKHTGHDGKNGPTGKTAPTYPTKPTHPTGFNGPNNRAGFNGPNKPTGPTKPSH